MGKGQKIGSECRAIRNLSTKDREQQLTAIETLLPTMPQDAIEPLVFLATGEDLDWDVQEKSKKLLWEYGPPTVPFIKSRLKGMRKEVPISLALTILAKIGSTEAVTTILRYIRGDSARCERLGSVEALLTHFGLFGNSYMSAEPTISALMRVYQFRWESELVGGGNGPDDIIVSFGKEAMPHVQYYLDCCSDPEMYFLRRIAMRITGKEDPDLDEEWKYYIEERNRVY